MFLFFSFFFPWMQFSCISVSALQIVALCTITFSKMKLRTNILKSCITLRYINLSYTIFKQSAMITHLFKYSKKKKKKIGKCRRNWTTEIFEDEKETSPLKYPRKTETFANLLPPFRQKFCLCIIGEVDGEERREKN